jgi:DNA-binding NarL/FixJ family response regulator
MTQQSPATKKTRIVLVDDHAVVRRGMAAIINDEPDLTVIGEADGMRSALELIERLRPDLALVDLAISDGDGLELIKEIRKRWKDVLVVVLSMYDESVYAERSLRAGARGFVMKAQAATTVLDAIRTAMAGAIYLSSEMRGKLPGAQPPQSDAQRTGLLGQLTDRELQVLRCIGRGQSAHEIGEELFISAKTVEVHREHIKHKLQLATSGDLLRYAIEHNRIQG